VVSSETIYRLSGFSRGRNPYCKCANRPVQARIKQQGLALVQVAVG
jgi:hypothetical protein